MVSLLKEYLDDSHEQVDAAIPSENDGKQNEADPEDCLNEVHTDNNHAHGSDKGEQDLQNHNTNKGSAPKQHFKNVVAIVDPPRSGLHPAVSDSIFIFHAHCILPDKFQQIFLCYLMCVCGSH